MIQAVGALVIVAGIFRLIHTAVGKPWDSVPMDILFSVMAICSGIVMVTGFK